MKNNYKMLIPVGIVAFSLLFSVNGFSQKKLPNGTVVYKNGTVKKTTTVSLPGGGVVLPKESRKYPKHRKHYHKGNGVGLPPGQAKKIYGGSATDYAPGQQKKFKKGKGH